MVASVLDHAAAEFADTGATGSDEVRFSTTVVSTLTLFAGDTGIERVTIGTGTAAVASTSGTVALNVDASAVLNGLAITGNTGINHITGTAFDDTIAGRGGNDVLTGGDGADAFLFNVTANTKTNFDTITDFTGGTDTLQFSKAIFKGLGLVAGPLSDAQFWTAAGGVAHDLDDRIIYDSATGIVWYDADGTGRAAKVAVAVLGTTTHPDLHFSDILIVN
jgi:Ca2+-binding RTX toxin-like protein